MPDREPPKDEGFGKAIITWILIVIGVWAVYRMTTKEPETRVSLTFFMEEIHKGKIKEVLVDGKTIKWKEGKRRYYVYLPFDDPELIREISSSGVEVLTKPPAEFWNYILPYIPFLLFFLFFFYLLRQSQSAPNKALNFGRARVRMADKTKTKVTFKDVAGVDEAKEELREIVEFLKNPQKFIRLGARIPKGILLVGPPGTGKTLLAKAVAGEANVPFFSISGSDFVELFVGVGASRVRDLFDKAKRNRPCIVFIDELDAVGRHRGAGIGGGHDEREQTLNALLVEMDGFDPNEGIIVLAATNRPDILDPALLRPGRFDRQVVVDIPDVRGREEILKVHTRKVPLAKDVDLSLIAKTTPGFTGADLASLVNEAALIAARKNKKKVSMEDFEEAKDKLLMGVERKSLIISEEEKRQTAYHEAGHALVSYLTPEADPVHKVTIIPRGRSLGVTQQLPLDDRRTYSKDYLMAQLTVLLGGRAAEIIALETLTTGAGMDIERATELAKRMVCEWGMSEKLGPLTFGKRGEVFLGRDFTTIRDFSDETAKLIDEEVKRLVEEAQERAIKLLKENRELLDKVAEELLKREVLTGEELDEIIRGSKKDRKSDKRNTAGNRGGSGEGRA